jgi:hypothetical protein
VEPLWVTKHLAAVEDLTGWNHDPCCGGGNIVNGLIQSGLTATGSDLRQRLSPPPPWFLGTADFVADKAGLWGADNCVFNPPYFRGAGTEQFIRHALKITKGKVCAFTEGRFLWGKKRACELWRDCPPDRIWFITPRPSCPPGAYLEAGNKAGGGTPDFVWLVWDERKGEARSGWLT